MTGFTCKSCPLCGIEQPRCSALCQRGRRETIRADRIALDVTNSPASPDPRGRSGCSARVSLSTSAAANGKPWQGFGGTAVERLLFHQGHSEIFAPLRKQRCVVRVHNVTQAGIDMLRWSEIMRTASLWSGRRPLRFCRQVPTEQPARCPGSALSNAVALDAAPSVV